MRSNPALFRIHASGINPSDVANSILDRFGGKKPIISGRDFAGTVIQAPSDAQLDGAELGPGGSRWCSLTAYLMREKAAARAGDVVLIFGAKRAV
ncbi:hypothetical protein NHQ30_007744 [Ciborinia camelliae]|nr:hypothetical protein NHQ30_007744 [Ciborinia camelliae]